MGRRGARRRRGGTRLGGCRTRRHWQQEGRNDQHLCLPCISAGARIMRVRLQPSPPLPRRLRPDASPTAPAICPRPTHSSTPALLTTTLRLPLSGRHLGGMPSQLLRPMTTPLAVPGGARVVSLAK